MCGIIGYIGEKNAVPYLIKGLKKLEYRGYDSAGIAVFEGEKIESVKATGKVKNLEDKLNERELSASLGIGHTRWATHGEVTERNAHPHLSYKGDFAIVHNGIIENYSSLRGQLIKDGYAFLSDTDSEVIAHLFEREFNGNIVNTVMCITKQLEGSYALAVISKNTPDTLILTKKDNPLIIGEGEDGFFVSSDISGICEFAGSAAVMEEGEIALIKKDRAEFYNSDGNEIKKIFNPVTFCPSETEKGEFEHFMLKEIFEQPEALRRTLSYVLSLGNSENEVLSFLPTVLERTERIYIAACGSAYHAALSGKYIFEKLTGIPTEADLAGEFRYREPPINNRCLFIAVSQSGETADTLAALRLAKEKGAFVLSIVNVPSSSIARESDRVIYTKAGPEIAVATTKAYTCQLGVLYTLGVTMGYYKGLFKINDYNNYIKELCALPEKIEAILARRGEEKEFASEFSKEANLRFIGRKNDYPAALEGALKMKEISYIPSEGYAAGELKHGTISLIEKGSVVIAIMGDHSIFKKSANAAEEIRSRGGKVITITTEKNLEDLSEINEKIVLPATEDIFVALLEAIPLQLLAYYTAYEKNCDIDKPRNLAKSVTVE